MQLVVQTDMFSEIPMGRRYWAVRSDSPADGHWVLVTEGENKPDANDVEDRLGFKPTVIAEVSIAQARSFYPRVDALKDYEYGKSRRSKRDR